LREASFDGWKLEVKGLGRSLVGFDGWVLRENMFVGKK
jgi:hypothetical protein